MKDKKLTIKQERFCNLFIELGNATEAYRQSYDCSKMKDKTISRRSSDLLNDGIITAYCEAIRSDLERSSQITRESIIEDIKIIKNARIDDYLTFEKGVLKFKSFSELTEDQLKAIESIKDGRNGIELKLHSKTWSIERICKMLGFDSPDKIEASILSANFSIIPMSTGKQTFASNEDEVDR